MLLDWTRQGGRVQCRHATVQNFDCADVAVSRTALNTFGSGLGRLRVGAAEAKEPSLVTALVGRGCLHILG